MIKSFGRRPILPILVLLCVGCAIYFVASGDTKSLGLAKTTRVEETSVEDLMAGPPKSIPEKAEHVKAKPSKEVQDSPQDSPQANLGMGGYTETPFMPKMANETLKAKLGNSAWHLFHTVLARYPDKPSEQEQTTLQLYIHLFAQVYPCGDCARHFQKLLARYPPQVGSRKTAALWGCDIHNKVNSKLKKPEYDCTKILEDYDCGCGDDEKQQDFTLGNESMEHLRGISVDEKAADKQLGG